MTVDSVWGPGIGTGQLQYWGLQGHCAALKDSGMKGAGRQERGMGIKSGILRRL